MKIGINLLLWTPHVTQEHFGLFETLRATGYDGVEIPLFEGDPAHYQEVARALQDNGLACTASTVIPDEAHSPISPQAAHRQAALEYLTWAVDCCAAMGAEVLAGPYYQPLGIFSGQGPTEEEKERAAEVHRRVADIAQGKGVLLVLEALNRFECYFLNTMDDAAAYVKRVGHPNLRLMFDTFHANIEEQDPVGCITRHLDLIRHVHISENDRGTPGRGHVPWLATFRALRQGGYDGWLTVEAFGRTLPELAATTCVWRDLSSGPEQVYTEAFRLIKSAWEEAG